MEPGDHKRDMRVAKPVYWTQRGKLMHVELVLDSFLAINKQHSFMFAEVILILQITCTLIKM
jgi:hypothetical protein